MKSDFRIMRHQNGENLHLMLAGDLNESSAREILHTVKREYKKNFKVFIHCSGLEQVDPSAQEIFLAHIKTLGEDAGSLFFTGEKSRSIVPEENRCS